MGETTETEQNESPSGDEFTQPPAEKQASNELEATEDNNAIPGVQWRSRELPNIVCPSQNIFIPVLLI